MYDGIYISTSRTPPFFSSWLDRTAMDTQEKRVHDMPATMAPSNHPLLERWNGHGEWCWTAVE